MNLLNKILRAGETTAARGSTTNPADADDEGGLEQTLELYNLTTGDDDENVGYNPYDTGAIEPR